MKKPKKVHISTICKNISRIFKYFKTVIIYQIIIKTSQMLLSYFKGSYYIYIDRWAIANQPERQRACTKCLVWIQIHKQCASVSKPVQIDFSWSNNYQNKRDLKQLIPYCQRIAWKLCTKSLKSVKSKWFDHDNSLLVKLKIWSILILFIHIMIVLCELDRAWLKSAISQLQLSTIHNYKFIHK